MIIRGIDEVADKWLLTHGRSQLHKAEGSDNTRTMYKVCNDKDHMMIMMKKINGEGRRRKI